MKIRRILSVFLLTVLMVSLMLTPQAYALPALEIKAKAAVLVDADEGRIIFGQNEQEREYPASITKVMTALLTLEAVDAGKLSLDQTALELTVGGTGKLTASGAEGITWTSSNADVAAVGEDGTVTAVAAGTATVSASAEGADPVTCTVTVKEAPKKDLVLRSIYQSEGTPLEQFAMWAGDPAVPMTVDGTDSPVQWSTEDSSIATINSDGEVTAVKSGKTMVVAVVDGQTLKCEVLVYDR